MLVPAKLYVKELTELIGMTATNPEYKWWHGSYSKATIEIDDNFWSCIQLVKLNSKKEIIGYYRASVSRPENYVDGLSCINFNLKDKMSFALGMREFLNYIINTLRMPKIKWLVYVGNPMEKSYDKLCERHGGRVIGTENYGVLISNKMHDIKHYQWLNKEVLTNY